VSPESGPVPVGGLRQGSGLGERAPTRQTPAQGVPRPSWARDVLDDLEDELAGARRAAASVIDRVEALLSLRSRAIDLARTEPTLLVTLERLLDAGDERERARVAALVDRAWPPDEDEA
jgi:hypothetical protein